MFFMCSRCSRCVLCLSNQVFQWRTPINVDKPTFLAYFIISVLDVLHIFYSICRKIYNIKYNSGTWVVKRPPMKNTLVQSLVALRLSTVLQWRTQWRTPPVLGSFNDHNFQIGNLIQNSIKVFKQKCWQINQHGLV